MITCIQCGCSMKHHDNDVSSMCLDCAGEAADKLSKDGLVAMAKVGIDALIDEATGYEKVRPKDDLTKRHKQYKKQ